MGSGDRLMRFGLTKKTVFVLGLRGFPEVQGGIESHCEHLYPYIAGDEFEVTVLVRRPYVPTNKSIGDIKLKSLWSPVTTGVEAFIHTFVGLLYTIVKRPDILHIHAIGPSLFAPVARLFGIKVICTHHGFDYEREKWGVISSGVLKLGELCAARFSNEMIAVSGIAGQRLSELYHREVHVINNGVEISPNPKPVNADVLDVLGVDPGKYFLSVSRIVEEKRQLDIINAFLASKSADYKLVVVGANGGSDEYFKAVIDLASSHDNVVLAGFQSGDDLVALYYHASAFVHASSLEGNPIVLLEALSFGLPIFASDIPPNLELSLDESSYFGLGDTVALAHKMSRHVESPEVKSEAKIRLATERYSWSSRAHETVAVYHQALGITKEPATEKFSDI